MDLANYVSYRTIDSQLDDGGNALFAALEYWDGGIVYSDERNCVAVAKNFAQKRYGVELDQAKNGTDR